MRGAGGVRGGCFAGETNATYYNSLTQSQHRNPMSSDRVPARCDSVDWHARSAGMDRQDPPKVWSTWSSPVQTHSFAFPLRS